MTTGAILSVRIATSLDRATAEKRIADRLRVFGQVAGLVEKHFGFDDATGNICGLYVFDSRAALDAYAASGLAASMTETYDAIHVRREIYDLLGSVRPAS